MYASLLFADSGNRLLDSMIFPRKTWLGSPANEGAASIVMRRTDEIRIVRKLIVLDGTRSRLEDLANRVESFAIGSVRTVDARCDLDSVTRKRAIQLS